MISIYNLIIFVIFHYVIAAVDSSFISFLLWLSHKVVLANIMCYFQIFMVK